MNDIFEFLTPSDIKTFYIVILAGWFAFIIIGYAAWYIISFICIVRHADNALRIKPRDPVTNVYLPVPKYSWRECRRCISLRLLGLVMGLSIGGLIIFAVQEQIQILKNEAQWEAIVKAAAPADGGGDSVKPTKKECLKYEGYYCPHDAILNWSNHEGKMVCEHFDGSADTRPEMTPGICIKQDGK